MILTVSLRNIINIYYNKLNKENTSSSGGNIGTRGKKMVAASHVKICGHVSVSGWGELPGSDVLLGPGFSITGSTALIIWYPGERKP